MNLIKRHKGLALVGGLTLILIVIIFIVFARMIFSTGDTVYGKRLNGIMEISSGVKKEIIEEVSNLEMVEDIDIRIQGKIVYTTIVFKEGTKVDKAKEIASNTLTKYDEDVLGYYDFGYFLKENIVEDTSEDSEENKKTGFVVAGTKHPDFDSISWTNS